MPFVMADNISEILGKIVEFTETRRQILTGNIAGIDREGFEPADLDIDEFVSVMAYAISEHIQSQRLVFCDGESVRFGMGGRFELRPVADMEALRLLHTDKNEYLKMQVRRLMENLANNRLAKDLLDKNRFCESRTG